MGFLCWIGMLNLRTTPLSSKVVATFPTPEVALVSVTSPTLASAVVTTSSICVASSAISVGLVTDLMVCPAYACVDICPLVSVVSVSRLIILSVLAMSFYALLSP